MNDQQLIEMLRALDRPFSPERAFAETLYGVLERRVQRRRGPSPMVLLAAALLAAAAVVAAIAAGSQLLQRQPVVVVPSPGPTSGTYVVNIPDGAVPASLPDAVAAAAAARYLGQVVEMTWIPAFSRVPVRSGGEGEFEFPVWLVEVVRTDGVVSSFTLNDDGLGVVLAATIETPGPEPTLVPLPTWDPSAPLELVSDLGRTIRPTIVPLPGIDATVHVSWLVARGDLLWATVGDASSGEAPALLRIDSRTGEVSTVALPPGMSDALLAGREKLWISSSAPGSGALHALDPVTGEIIRTFPGHGLPLAVDADGLWFRTYSEGAGPGMLLLDPQTGAEVRRFDTPDEGEGHSFRGIWNPPAFGSLWDTDRARGAVLRLDRFSGAVLADISLGSVIDARDWERCQDPREGPSGVAELEPVIFVHCRDGFVVIDPATNSILRYVPVTAECVACGAMYVGLGLDGQLWAPGDSGTLIRVDPTTLAAIETLSFNRPGIGAATLPVVVGGEIWFVVAERRPNDIFDQNQVLVRIPVAQLTQ